ncbi:Putative DASH complex subunit Hsk3 [Penicillium brasilianum]|uniref:Putative DASH complex subunit Hsk3 n=1 Tax=Penicillium brasilianum TaxID=104259 RepID=A0A0F7TWC9_PENBI|nr:Putative DASH complex subunit Hsk3 [Penicillium brasilianum]
MPLNPTHHRTDSHPSYPRATILPNSTSTNLNATTTHNPYQSQHNTQYQNQSTSSGTASMSASKQRQYAHLHAQLAQLNANLADTQNLLRMTAVQAGDIRFLGGYMGALFMGSAKVLGEEGVKGCVDGGSGIKKEESEED